MPAITFQSLELADEQKEILAERVTALFSELTHVPPDRIYVFFDGYSHDCAGANGKLFSKAPPKLAVGKWNWDQAKQER